MDIGHPAFSMLLEFDIILGCRTQRNESGDLETHIGLRDFVHNLSCVASSVIPKHVSSRWSGAQKNGLRLVWPSTVWLVRPARAACSRSFQWRYADLSGDRNTSRTLPPLRTREAGTAGMAGGQSVLHEAVCALRRPALPAGHNSGHRAGTSSGLGYRQDSRQAIHASPACKGRNARAESDRY